jgi:hypothetical protein
MLLRAGTRLELMRLVTVRVLEVDVPMVTLPLR